MTLFISYDITHYHNKYYIMISYDKYNKLHYDIL